MVLHLGTLNSQLWLVAKCSPREHSDLEGMLQCAIFESTESSSACYEGGVPEGGFKCTNNLLLRPKVNNHNLLYYGLLESARVQLLVEGPESQSLTASLATLGTWTCKLACQGNLYWETGCCIGIWELSKQESGSFGMRSPFEKEMVGLEGKAYHVGFHVHEKPDGTNKATPQPSLPCSDKGSNTGP